MARARRLLLLTTNHPFTYTGGETMFIVPELPHLVEAFAASGVGVAPLHDTGEQLPMPEGATLLRGLAAAWRAHRVAAYLRAPAWPGFWPELWRGLRQGGLIGAVRVWRWAAAAQAVWRWLPAAVQADESVLLYTYWRGGATLAAARWARQHAGCAAVTRVHRYELYADAFARPFQPWVSVYDTLARVIPISRHGQDYLLGLGVSPARIALARLGVPAAPWRTAASTDGVCRLVSCSTVTPVKRVPFTARAIVAFARAHPAQRVEWLHFGGGPELAAVELELRAAPPNLHAALRGRVAHAEVAAHYAQVPVDLFVLLSASEGLPVAIQEALAAGIPVLACDVGGVGEAVPDSGDNGALLAPDVGVDGVVGRLRWLLIDSTAGDRQKRRDAALAVWAERFNANHNHAVLARSLRDDIL